MVNESPFHEGERRVQTRLGVREQIEPWARQVVRAYIPEEHRVFYQSLPFLVAAARDFKGRPWATLLTGSPGFIGSPDPRRLAIHARPRRGGALESALVPGTELGLLGIELATRRRNRVNGHIVKVDPFTLLLEVDQAFGNCPQYIHPRSWRWAPEPSERPPARRTTRLSPAMREWIRGADTFFIASGYQGGDDSPVYGMDASHRGGDPGFVHIESDTCLVFPDYAGNNHFNTIGNLIMDPRAGLLFVDFERGSLLQLTGRSRIDWDSEAVSRFPGARRLVAFTLEEVIELEAVLPLRWSSATEFVRSLRLVKKVRESEDASSFVFAGRDGGLLAAFEAGRHLPIELDVPGYREPVRRTYSLSNGPNREHYRISVKREPFGVASRHIHDRLKTGAIINGYRPAGESLLCCTDRPTALISAGIGRTPIASMLHALTGDPRARPVWFIHGARDGGHHPLSDEVRALAEKRENVHAHFAYSRPRPLDRFGVDYHTKGRVDIELVARLMPDLDAEFYLCGPMSFMTEIQMGLKERGVPTDRIHVESFGPVN